MSSILQTLGTMAYQFERKYGLAPVWHGWSTEIRCAVKRCLLIAAMWSAFAALIAASAVSAQTVSQPQGDVVPPAVTTQSPTGVDLATGTSTYKKVDLTIGSLTLERFYRYNTNNQDPDTMFYGAHWSNNFDVFVGMSLYEPSKASESQTVVPEPIVHMGDNASGMYMQTGGWAQSTALFAAIGTDAQAGNLGYDSNNNYVYTDQSDTVYVFNSQVSVVGAKSASSYQPHTQRIASITSPDGYVKTFTYNSSGQLINVADNKGYAIVFDYNSSGQIADACGFDLSSTYITSSTTCANATLKVSYSYANGQLTNVVDVMGQTETYGYQSTSGYSAVNCITPPGYSTCKIAYNYGLSSLTQTMSDGSVWTFGWTYMATAPTVTGYTFVAHNGDNPTSSIDPEGNKTSILFTGTTPESMTDALGNTTNYTFVGNPNFMVPTQSPPLQNGSLLSTVTMPEGNEYLQSPYGPYNTVIQRIRRSKPGSGIADIVENLSYNCPNDTMTPSCAKPVAITDALGNETDYAYESFGAIQSEMKPAPSSGAPRPLTVYTYVQQAAAVLNASGSLASSATQIYLPSTVTQCNFLAGSSPPACDPSGPQEVTTYQYGPSGTARNLLLRGEAVTANGVTLLTCYAYDAQSNQISKTSPRAGLTTCP